MRSSQTRRNILRSIGHSAAGKVLAVSCGVLSMVGNCLAGDVPDVLPEYPKVVTGLNDTSGNVVDLIANKPRFIVEAFHGPLENDTFGHSRFYQQGQNKEIGKNWGINEHPWVIISDSAVTVNSPGTFKTLVFDKNGSTYTVQSGSKMKFQLTYNDTNKEYVLIESTGRGIKTLAFFGDDNEIGRLGKLKWSQDPAGYATRTVCDITTGQITQMHRFWLQNGDSPADFTTLSNSYERMTYSYNVSDKLESVAYDRVDSISTVTNLWHISYTYAADLLTNADVWRGSSSGILSKKSFYKYTDDRLKFIVSPEAYRRASVDGVTVDGNLNETTQSQYMSHQFEGVAGWFTTSNGYACLLAKGTPRASYTLGRNLSIAQNLVGFAKYNSWEYRTKVTLSDTTGPSSDNPTETVYSNGMGQPILVVLNSGGASPTTHYHYIRYTDRGQIDFTTDSYAVIGFDENYDYLLDKDGGENWEYLANNVGKFTNYVYGKSSTASEDLGGDVEGMLKRIELKKGELATAIRLSSYTYFSRDLDSQDTGVYAGLNTYVLASSTQYRDEIASQLDTTEYSYSWQASKQFQIQTIINKMPIVSVTEHGSGIKDQLQAEFNIDGQLILSRNANGYWDSYAYDSNWKTLTQVNNDVTGTTHASLTARDVSLPSAVNILKATYTRDQWGRLTSMLQQSDTYQIAAGTATLSPNTYWVYNDQDVYTTPSSDKYDTVGFSKGYNLSSVDYLEGLIEVKKYDKNGQLVEEFETIRTTGSGALALSDLSPIVEHKSQHKQYTYSLSGIALTGVKKSNYLVSTSLNTFSHTLSLSEGLIQVIETPGTSSFNTYVKPTFDVFGNEVKSEKGMGTTSAASYQIVDKRTYDLRGDLIELEEWESGAETGTNVTVVTEYKRDWRGRVINIIKDEHTINISYDNQDRVTQVDRKKGPILGQRIQTWYDSRGNNYRQATFSIGTDGAVAQRMFTQKWFDGDSNLVKIITPESNGSFTKYTYDWAGRETGTYQGDGADIADQSKTAYEYSLSIDDDKITTQVQKAYDSAGNLIDQLTIDRGVNDEVTLGALTPAGDTKVSVIHHWYNSIGRKIGTADYGNQLPVDVNTIPNTTAAINVIKYEYITEVIAGPPIYFNQALKTISNYGGANAQTRLVEYHPHGNVLRTIENYIDGLPGNDNDITTTYIYDYDGLGQLLLVNTLDAASAEALSSAFLYVTPSLPNTDILSGELIYSTSYADGSIEAYKYNRLGQIKEKTDRVGSTHKYTYDALGRTTQELITAFGTGVYGADINDDAVRKIDITYNNKGLLESVTSSRDNGTTVMTAQPLNKVELAYNAYGQSTSSKQTYHYNDGAAWQTVDHTITHSYTDDNDSVIQRRISTTYPNGRKIYYGYGEDYLLSDKYSRVETISEDNGSGAAGDAIVSYKYAGNGTIISKSYPTPGIRYDNKAGGATGEYEGLDSFGRTRKRRWAKYNTGTSSDIENVLDIDYGYNTASIRTHARRNVDSYKGFSQAYNLDNLNRMTSFQAGHNVSDLDNAIATKHRRHDRDWTLDSQGNPTSIKDHGYTDFHKSNFNTSNQLADSGAVNSRESRTDKNSDFFLTTFSAATDADKYNAVNGESFTVSSGKFKISTLASYTNIGTQGLALTGEAVGLTTTSFPFTFPAGTTTGQAGVVFGFKSITDYWLKVYDAADSKIKIIHVHDIAGTITKDVKYEATSTVKTDGTTNHGTFLAGKNSSVYNAPYADINGGFPTGKMGLYTTVAGVEFDYLKIALQSRPGNYLSRWDNFSSGQNGSSSWYADKDQHFTAASINTGWQNAMLLRGFRSNNYRVTMAFKRGDVSYNQGRLVFMVNAKDNHNFAALEIPHSNGTGYATTPRMYQTAEGKTRVWKNNTVSSTIVNANYPRALAYNDMLWARVIRNGPDVKLYAINQATKPTETQWTNATLMFQVSDLQQDGGRIGFSNSAGYIFQEQVQVENNIDTTGNGTTDTWVTDYIDNFTIADATNRRPLGIEYDTAGNLTYDGTYKYTYDAWNKLVKIQRAYKVDYDSSGSQSITAGDNPTAANGSSGSVSLGALQIGSTVGQFAYDALNRRIQKKILNSADQNFTYNYYYNDKQAVEIRNGTDFVIKQNIWGIQDENELIQIGINHQNIDNTIDRKLWALTDANNSVLGIVSATGHLLERYEYTPYGARQVYSHGYVLEGDIDFDGDCDADDLALYTANSSIQDADYNGVPGELGDLFTIRNNTGKTTMLENDPSVLIASQGSWRNSKYAGITNTVALNTIGHNGLTHDEEFEVGPNANLIYTQNRTLHTALGRFNQPNELGTLSESNQYTYNPTTTDQGMAGKSKLTHNTNYFYNAPLRSHTPTQGIYLESALATTLKNTSTNLKTNYKENLGNVYSELTGGIRSEHLAESILVIASRQELDSGYLATIAANITGTDSDGDGLTDTEEIALGTNIYLSDTDGDGHNDGWEYINGTDPTLNQTIIFSVAGALPENIGNGHEVIIDSATIPEVIAKIDSNSRISPWIYIPEGTYAGEIIIDKKIYLIAAGSAEKTIIDCSGVGRGFIVDGNQVPNVATGVSIVGFTITGADNSNGNGGAFYIKNANPTIINCIITNNKANYGAGFFLESAFPRIYGCKITNNTAVNKGGGILFFHPTDQVPADGQKLKIQRTFIRGNTAGVSGAGVSVVDVLPSN